MLTDTSIQTLADALDAAPEHDDLPYGEHERVAERSGWPDDGERHDTLKRVLRGDGGMTAVEVADHRTVDANQQQVAQALKSMREARAVKTETDGETGRTTWRLTTFAE